MEELAIRRETGATGTTTILRLIGPLTLETLLGLQDALHEIGEVDTIVDMSETPYIDSAGLGAILGLWTHTQRVGKRFALTGVSPRIEALLELTKVNTLLPMFRTAKEADQEFTGRKSAPKA